MIHNYIYVMIINLYCLSIMQSYTFKLKTTSSFLYFHKIKQCLGSSPNDLFSVNEISQHKFSVAPMMDYTDRFQRFFQRLLSKHAVLYTEMVTTNAIVHRHKNQEKQRDLEPNVPIEEPCVLQVGGNDPIQMKDAAVIAINDYGYKQININCGCPSEKVAGAGCFGAQLMLYPNLVSELALSIGEVLNRPATIKCRIGVNDMESYEELYKFIDLVSSKAKVTHFIIHARKAILNAKFSPEDNRKIPPLKYDYVYRLVKDFPQLFFTLNGGVQDIESSNTHLEQGVHGVMVGRSVINNPFYWRNIDSKIYLKDDPGLNRREILSIYATYARQQEIELGPRARRALIKPIINLFHGEHRTKQFKVLIDELVRNNQIPIDECILKASFENNIDDNILDQR